VKVYHYGDEEPQVVFYGDTATDMIPAINEDGMWKLVSSKTGETIVEKDTLGELGEWLQTNFAQYSKSLL
jgi:hypothetical protein